MEASPTELRQHVTRINAVLQETCNASAPAPLVHLDDTIITLATSCPAALSRKVTTDLGVSEIALRLPIPDAKHPRFWIALHERWRWKSVHRLCFDNCGLRLYMGGISEEAIQFLRLEWVAPTTHDGTQAYQGTHVGHPHWHIDRSALVGSEEYLLSIEKLTTPLPKAEIETFSESSAVLTTPEKPCFDFSWLQKVHLPAQAQWMRSEWDGRQVPGPHQCEPGKLIELANWWAGAVRYVSAELPRRF